MLSKMISRIFCVIAMLTLCEGTSHQVAKKHDPNDNKGNTPFFLQDPSDQMCLGAHGFTLCDESALWILTKRSGRKTYSLISLLNPQSKGACLQRKKSFFGLTTDKLTVGGCGNGNSKTWMFEFIDQTHVKLSNEGQCLVRGKKHFKNSFSLQNCNKGEFVPLVYHPTAVHEDGFLIKAADGTCFDGSKFRSCSGTGSNGLLWGLGVKYLWNGEAARYFFNFKGDRSECLVSSGSKVERGLCSDSGALHWGLHNSELSKGKKCLARLADDSAVMAKCGEESEFIAMEIPTTTKEPVGINAKQGFTSEEMSTNPSKKSSRTKV